MVRPPLPYIEMMTVVVVWVLLTIIPAAHALATHAPANDAHVTHPPVSHALTTSHHPPSITDDAIRNFVSRNESSINILDLTSATSNHPPSISTINSSSHSATRTPNAPVTPRIRPASANNASILPPASPAISSSKTPAHPPSHTPVSPSHSTLTNDRIFHPAIPQLASLAISEYKSPPLPASLTLPTFTPDSDKILSNFRSHPDHRPASTSIISDKTINDNQSHYPALIDDNDKPTSSHSAIPSNPASFSTNNHPSTPSSKISHPATSDSIPYNSPNLSILESHQSHNVILPQDSPIVSQDTIEQQRKDRYRGWSSPSQFSRTRKSGERIKRLESHLEGLGDLGDSLGLTRTNETNPNVKLWEVEVVDFPDEQPKSPSNFWLFSSPSKNMITRRSTDAVTSNSLSHRHRHGHSRTPGWMKRRIHKIPLEIKNQVITSHFEEDIADVFRDVAYGKSEPETTQRAYYSEQPANSGVNSRIERTTVLSEQPQDDYTADRGDGNGTRGQRNASPFEDTPTIPREEELGKNQGVSKKSEPVSTNSTNEVNSKTSKSAVEKLIEVEEYDHDSYDAYEGHYSDMDDDKSNVSRRGDSHALKPSQWADPSDTSMNDSNVDNNRTQAMHKEHRKVIKSRNLTPRVSWFDVLLCTNRNLSWILINFLFGFILLVLSLLGPYRLLTLRSCSPLLPRTHYVAVHLLVFVAASLKAVYLFHLAYGSRVRLPLILILLLTNTGFPCFCSAFLILMIMMFLTADVQVYKPKFLTMQNIFIFIVMKLVLCFVADVIVGCAHSKSVLVLSRVMLIIVAVALVLVFVRKHQMVLQVSQMLQREFQGELKLLVLPAKDVSQQRQMGIKFILRNRLSLWCQIMKFAAVCISLLAVIHLFHTIFLISSHVPAWAWWIFHVSGCITDSIMSVLICMAAALTQRYDEKISFLYNFFVPPILVRKKKAAKSNNKNGETVYQRVSFSSGTESTQYTTCYPEAGRVGQHNTGPSRTPKAPKRRGATVRRSATFSHAPYYRPEPRSVRGRVIPQPMVPRAGSTSQIPIYSPGSGSHLSIYGPSLVSHLPIYNPPSDASVLVHEDGFVRVRTQTDPNEGKLYPRGSLIRLQQSHFVGSHPQLQVAPPQQLNGLGRQESFYASLSRRRRSPHGADVLQNNIDVPEGEYQPSPRSRRSHSNRSHRPYPASQAEADYHSLSRKRSYREPRVEQLNNVEEENDYPRRRRRSSREPNHYYLNNLDHPEGDYKSLTQRQVSREDNNDPRNLQPLDVRRSDRLPPLNLYEEHPGIHPHHASPSTRHKISNISVPGPSPAVSPGHNNYAAASPLSPRRQAQFPRPFVRAGSNASLQGEDYFYNDYMPRGNPVRRNHSSAGYYPSRNIAPSSPSLADTRRYGSLRLSAVKKRQAGHHDRPSGSGRMNHENYDRYRGRTEDEDTISELPGPLGPERKSSPRDQEGKEERERDCPSRQSNASKRSDGSDQDWATELINSSSILTDFYTLERPSKKKSSKNKKTISEDNDS